VCTYGHQAHSNVERSEVGRQKFGAPMRVPPIESGVPREEAQTAPLRDNPEV
jgi:hypothetical protein